MDMLGHVKTTYFDGSFSFKSFANDGEDMILRRIFRKQEKGFYVDVGAHHPKRFSNTYFFYKKGWRGINIDAMPGSMELFKKLRDRDVNIERAVSDKIETLTYYIFNEPALNSFSRELSLQRHGIDGYRIMSEIKKKTCMLHEILDIYLPDDQNIDFLNIDVEGFDLNVLRSNNWQKYKPNIILVEGQHFTCEEALKGATYGYVKSKGYELISKTLDTLIFKKDGLHLM